MEYCDDHDGVIFDDVEHAKRKATSQSAADLSMNLGELGWVFLNRQQRRFYGQQQALTQTRSALLVLLERFRQVRLGFLADDQLNVHVRGDIRPFTISHGEPAAGSR